jgi:hypothetical protein
MIASNGEGGGLYYKSRNKYAIKTDNTDRLTVDNSSVTVTNNLNVSKDINAAGGYAMAFTFAKPCVKQGTFSSMTASYMSSADDLVAVAYVGVPMPRSGSVLGLSIRPRFGEVVKSGSLSASIMIDNVNVACNLWFSTGTFKCANAVSKDSITFTEGQALGVSLTASSAFLSEPTITSASFIATVLIEC